MNDVVDKQMLKMMLAPMISFLALMYVYLVNEGEGGGGDGQIHQACERQRG